MNRLKRSHPHQSLPVPGEQAWTVMPSILCSMHLRLSNCLPPWPLLVIIGHSLSTGHCCCSGHVQKPTLNTCFLISPFDNWPCSESDSEPGTSGQEQEQEQNATLVGTVELSFAASTRARYLTLNAPVVRPYSQQLIHSLVKLLPCITCLFAICRMCAGLMLDA